MCHDSTASVCLGVAEFLEAWGSKSSADMLWSSQALGAANESALLPSGGSVLAQVISKHAPLAWHVAQAGRWRAVDGLVAWLVERGDHRALCSACECACYDALPLAHGVAGAQEH